MCLFLFRTGDLVCPGQNTGWKEPAVGLVVSLKIWAALFLKMVRNPSLGQEEPIFHNKIFIKPEASFIIPDSTCIPPKKQTLA